MLCRDNYLVWFEGLDTVSELSTVSELDTGQLPKNSDPLNNAIIYLTATP